VALQQVIKRGHGHCEKLCCFAGVGDDQKQTVPLIRTIAGPLASDRPTRQLRKVGQRHKGNRLRDAVGAHVKIILPLQETIGRSAFDGLDQPD